MAEVKYTVETLARLCEVDKETVRRWRIRGIRGERLLACGDNESDDQLDKVKGKPILFTADALRKFVAANPKLMTPQLKQELDSAQQNQAELSYDVAYQQTAPATTADNQMNFYYSNLLKRRQELFNQYQDAKSRLEEIDALIADFKGE